jgi:hypothetical protein
MVELEFIQNLQVVAYLAQIIGVVGTLTAAFIAVRSYINANKRAEEAKKKEQETREHELETRQAQLFMNIYDKISKKEFSLSWRRFVNAKFTTYEEFKQLQQTDKEFYEAVNDLAMFYEGLGVLVRENLLPIRMVALLICGMTRAYWEKFIPVYDDGVKALGFSRWMSETKFIYEVLLKYLGEHPELDSRIEKPIPRIPQ